MDLPREVKTSRGGEFAPLTRPLPRPPWLPESVWPFVTRSLAIDGVRVAITEAGCGSAILFVHTGLWSFIWRDVIARLADEFRCITFDSPGTGCSDRIPPCSVTLATVSRAVSAIIEVFNLDDLTLVFHDLGGPAAVAAAAQFPERIRGLAAVNTFAWRPSGALFRTMLAVMGSAPVREFDSLTRLLERIASGKFGVGRHLDACSRAAFRAGIGSEGLRSFHRFMYDARACDPIYQRAQMALIGPMKHLPLITIFGERNDPFGFQAQWKAILPHAVQVVVKKGNHFPMCDDPELVANSIRSWHRRKMTIVAQESPDQRATTSGP